MYCSVRKSIDKFALFDLRPRERLLILKENKFQSLYYDIQYNYNVQSLLQQNRLLFLNYECNNLS